MPLFSLGGKHPQVHESAFVAPTATLIGDVVVEANASIWFGVVLRGDSGRITIGEGSNVQDNTVIHERTTIGPNCTVAHLVLAHGIEVGEGSMIANGTTAFGPATIGAESLIAAGSLLTPNTDVEPGTLMVGSPARPARATTEAHREMIRGNVRAYRELGARYRADLGPSGDDAA